MLTKGFTREELEENVAVELPDRTEMSLINANVAAPINAATGYSYVQTSAANVGILDAINIFA